MYPEIILICLDEFGKFHPGTSVSFGEKLSAVSLPSSADDQLLHLPSHSPAIVWERHNIWSGMKSEYFLNDCDMVRWEPPNSFLISSNVSWDNLDMSWWIRQIPPWHFCTPQATCLPACAPPAIIIIILPTPVRPLRVPLPRRKKNNSIVWNESCSATNSGPPRMKGKPAIPCKQHYKETVLQRKYSWWIPWEIPWWHIAPSKVNQGTIIHQPLDHGHPFSPHQSLPNTQEHPTGLPGHDMPPRNQSLCAGVKFFGCWRDESSILFGETVYICTMYM